MIHTLISISSKHSKSEFNFKRTERAFIKQIFKKFLLRFIESSFVVLLCSLYRLVDLLLDSTLDRTELHWLPSLSSGTAGI